MLCLVGKTHDIIDYSPVFLTLLAMKHNKHLTYIGDSLTESNVLNLRICMPITADLSKHDFITKITTYNKIYIG